MHGFNDNFVKPVKIAVPHDDDFEFCALVHEQVIHGDIFSCVDGNWTDGEGKDIPLDKPFICLGTAQVVQRFENGMPVKEDVYIRTAGGWVYRGTISTCPPGIDDLNAKIPQDQWGLGIDGTPSRPPWSHSYMAYLLDPVDASIHTYINNTGGAQAAIRLLNDRVKWMRALRGARVFSVVTLGKRLHSKKNHKFGPNFIVLNFRELELGGGTPAEEAPRQLEQLAPQSDPVKRIGKAVDDPTWSEILDDDLPDTLKPAASEQTKPAATEQTKPAATKQAKPRPPAKPTIGDR
jgi:hypothetical protein